MTAEFKVFSQNARRDHIMLKESKNTSCDKYQFGKISFKNNTTWVDEKAHDCSIVISCTYPKMVFHVNGVITFPEIDLVIPFDYVHAECKFCNSAEEDLNHVWNRVRSMKKRMEKYPPYEIITKFIQVQYPRLKFQSKLKFGDKFAHTTQSMLIGTAIGKNSTGWIDNSQYTVELAHCARNACFIISTHVNGYSVGTYIFTNSNSLENLRKENAIPDHYNVITMGSPKGIFDDLVWALHQVHKAMINFAPIAWIAENHT